MSFSRFGIDHLSPSSLNLWLAEPAMWVLRYVHGYKDRAGPAMARGTAVEAGMQALLAGTVLDGAVTAAHVNYDLNEPEDRDGREEERALIAPMLAQVAGAVAGWPLPVSYQRKVSLRYEGGESVPIVGYVDFEMDDCVVDLKTTKALPSKPRAEHVRQVSLYALATGKAARLAYVTPKKFAVYDVAPSDIEAGWQQLRRAARALEKTLAASPSTESLNDFCVPNFDSYYWDEQSILRAKEVYNVLA